MYTLIPSDWKYVLKSVVLSGEYWMSTYNIIYYKLNGTIGLTTVLGWNIYFFLFSARDPTHPKVDARDQVFARSDRTPWHYNTARCTNYCSREQRAQRI